MLRLYCDPISKLFQREYENFANFPDIFAHLMKQKDVFCFLFQFFENWNNFQDFRFFEPGHMSLCSMTLDFVDLRAVQFFRRV